MKKILLFLTAIVSSSVSFAEEFSCKFISENPPAVQLTVLCSLQGPCLLNSKSLNSTEGVNIPLSLNMSQSTRTVLAFENEQAQVAVKITRLRNGKLVYARVFDSKGYEAGCE